MYALVRKYYVIPGRVEDFMHWLQDSFVPLVSQAQGFVAYYVLKARSDEVITFTSFETQAAAAEAGPLKAAWIAQNGPLFLQGLPETAAGEVGACSRGQDPDDPLKPTILAGMAWGEEIKSRFPELVRQDNPLMGII
jgi:hypothetical protein